MGAAIEVPVEYTAELLEFNNAEYKRVPGAVMQIAAAMPHWFEPPDVHPFEVVPILPSRPEATTITVVSLKSSS